MLLRAGCPPHAPKCLPRARAPRRPRRSALACPPCPRAGRVFPSAQPIDSDQCRKVPPPSSLPSLATGAAQQRRFVLPSCCFPRALLSASSPQSASGARSLERAGPPQVLAQRAPSVRGARSFTPPHSLSIKSAAVVAAAFSRDRCEVNAGHCLRTRCFLRRPLLARAAGRLRDRTRPRHAVAASGLPWQGPSPCVSNHLPTGLPQEALGQLFSAAACGCRPLLTVPTSAARRACCFVVSCAVRSSHRAANGAALLPCVSQPAARAACARQLAACCCLLSSSGAPQPERHLSSRLPGSEPALAQ